MPLGSAWAVGRARPSRSSRPKTRCRSSRKTSSSWPTATPIRAIRSKSPIDSPPNIPHLAKTLAQRLKLAEEMPLLAQLRRRQRVRRGPARRLRPVQRPELVRRLRSRHMSDDLSIYLDPSSRAIPRQVHAAQPQAALPLYHLVGALDPLTDGRREKAIGDGLPGDVGASGSRPTA